MKPIIDDIVQARHSTHPFGWVHRWGVPGTWLCLAWSAANLLL